jgi:4-hydroxy-tetrahydrodipicolinate synthase
LAAIEQGADAISLLPPYFLNPSRDAVIDHVDTVLEAVAPVTVVLQYAPGLTGSSLDAPAIAALATARPNLRFVKVEANPPGRVVTTLLSGSPAVPALVGYAGMLLPDALQRGAAGVQPGCSFTELYVLFWRLWTEGNQGSANRLYGEVLPFLSYWMQHPELIIAAEKLISYRRGLIACANCRKPAWHLDGPEVAMVDDGPEVVTIGK